MTFKLRHDRIINGKLFAKAGDTIMNIIVVSMS